MVEGTLGVFRDTSMSPAGERIDLQNSAPEFLAALGAIINVHVGQRKIELPGPERAEGGVSIEAGELLFLLFLLS